MKKVLGILGLIACISLSIVGCSSNGGDESNKGDENKSKEAVEINISAAASLKDAMVKIEEEYKKVDENIKLVVNYGSSGSLQQQIEQGAPCDLFISAGKKQIDQLNEKGLLLSDTVKDLVKNDLVLIAPKESKITSINDLTTENVKKIAVGEANSVPAGKYADEVLTNLNLKDKVQDKLVFAKDVKEVLAWVQSGNADVGFVYFSDTVKNDKINIVEKTSEDTHSPITYPVAVIKDSKKADAAKKFEEFLFSNEGQEIFKEYGYKSVN